MSAEDFARGEGAQLAPQHERRRSQRVTLRVRVKLHVAIEGKPDSVQAFTANVNDHGALLVSPESFQTEDRFVLEHSHTRQRMGCRVTRRPEAIQGGFQVAVEFDGPAPGFWQIVFPPTSWKAET
jgi:PilZ domain